MSTNGVTVKNNFKEKLIVIIYIQVTNDLKALLILIYGIQCLQIIRV